jgi:putative hydroxymethylpyrimidine transport system substrate-binding protein
MKLAWRLVLTGGFLLFLVGCGSSDQSVTGAQTEAASHVKPPPHKLRELGITLNGWHGPAHLGILMAGAREYFADAGLEVHTYTPATPVRPIPYVVEGEVDLSVAQMPQVVMAKEAGAPIVVLGGLIARPTAALIWLKRSHLRGLADLRGKTVGFPGVPFQRAFLEHALARAGIPPAAVQIKAVGYDLLKDLTDGRVDAIFGGSANLEGVKLSARGLKPVITPVKELGIPPYAELVVVARRESVAKNPALYRKLMAAIRKGTEAALENPEQAPELIQLTAESEPFTGPGVTKSQVEATLSLLSRSGTVDPEQTKALIDWMKEQGMIEKTFPAQAILAQGNR